MTVRSSIVAAALVLLAAGAVFLARPLTFEIDGLSMAPGLLPGDLVATAVPTLIDRLRRPARFERWVLDTADGTRAIKRIAGLPGETVAILTGDLAVNGVSILKGPRLLAGMGSRQTTIAAHGRPGEASGWHWDLPPHEVLDHADFAPQERSRVLLPVRDVGLAAVVVVRRLPATGGVRIRARVAGWIVPCRLRAAGRHAVVAGRLDGHLVAAAWPLPAAAAAGPRSCLPDDAPATWDLAVPWPQPAVEDVLAPHLAVGCEVDDSIAVIEGVTEWRDMLYRPAADGTGTWRLGADEFLVLGDFPAGSIDSRHWGPLRRTTLRHRITTP